MKYSLLKSQKWSSLVSQSKDLTTSRKQSSNLIIFYQEEVLKFK